MDGVLLTGNVAHQALSSGGTGTIAHAKCPNPTDTYNRRESPMTEVASHKGGKEYKSPFLSNRLPNRPVLLNLPPPIAYKHYASATFQSPAVSQSSVSFSIFCSFPIPLTSILCCSSYSSFYSIPRCPSISFFLTFRSSTSFLSSISCRTSTSSL